MNYDCKKPCNDCPFHVRNKHGYKISRLVQFALSPFHCHKTGDYQEEEYDDDGEVIHSGGFVANGNSSYCAGAIIFLEKRKELFTHNTPEEVVTNLMKYKNLVR
jgi:hypothetical protein